MFEDGQPPTPRARTARRHGPTPVSSGRESANPTPSMVVVRRQSAADLVGDSEAVGLGSGSFAAGVD